MEMGKKLRGGVALACAAALVSAPVLLVPVTAQAAIAPATSRAALPKMTAKLSKKSITLKGTNGLRAGRVELKVTGKGVVEFAMFKHGYDARDFTEDLFRFGAKNDVKALKHALANTQMLGGVSGGGTGTIVLPKAGSYTPISMSGPRPILGRSFTVGAVHKSRTPKTDGTIIGVRGPGWGGSSTLPAKGTFLFKNKGNTGVPHFVLLQQVAEGTTTDQVLESLQGDEQGPPPPWAMQAGLETGSLSPGRSMTVDYDLPAGQYVVMCFFPDPKMGGMPHALMGMLEMIHLS